MPAALAHGSRLRLLLVVTVTLVNTACSGNTLSQLKMQQLDELTQRLSALQSLHQDLASHPTPESDSDFSAFISLGTFNSVLQKADNLSIPLDSFGSALKDAQLTVQTIRVSFAHNYPELSIRAFATQPKDSLTVCVSLLSELLPVPSPDPTKLSFRVHVLSVVPSVRWGPLQFKLGRFASNLLNVNVNSLTAKLPVFSLPIRSSIDLNFPDSAIPITIPSDDGSLTAALRIKGASFNGALVVKRLLFLSDGVHVFLTLTGASS